MLLSVWVETSICFFFSSSTDSFQCSFVFLLTLSIQPKHMVAGSMPYNCSRHKTTHIAAVNADHASKLDHDTNKVQFIYIYRLVSLFGCYVAT